MYQSDRGLVRSVQFGILVYHVSRTAVAPLERLKILLQVFKILIVFSIMELSKASSIYGKVRVFEDYLEAMVLTVLGLSPIRRSSSLAMNKHQGKFNQGLPLVPYRHTELNSVWYSELYALEYRSKIIIIKVCNFDLPGGTYRSARLLVREPLTTGRFRQKLTVDGRLREKSTVGSRLGKKKGRGKEEQRGKERIPRLRAVLARAPSSPAGCQRTVAARGRFFSLVRRRS
ncbi:hypothetical protein B296_00026161, partial [Ensete ventricosum]